ncbi:MAG TPA: purine-nucleoside phosphorylase [Bacteroidales bacterium]|nr:purine-nucleoside phosphorylase [Bacteroidales bacterium]
MLTKIKETVAFIRSKTSFEPQTGIILGTGLGNLANEIKVHTTIPYSEIPNFPVSTVVGHKGQLVFGTLNDVNVVAMQGRFHYYEGYTMQEVAFPVRVLKYLGIKTLILSNASGGVNPSFEVGDIMIITDHINLMGTNPLIGKNDDEIGPRFPDMHDAYDKELIKKALMIAENNGIRCVRGVYAAVTGPCFETPSEYKYVRTVGADCVGMSTVPEVIVAHHMGLPVFAVSIITDLGVEGKIVEVSHEEVIQAANNAEPKMTTIIKGLITVI